MSLLGVNSGPFSTILGFLDGKQSANLAQTHSYCRAQVKKNVCIVVEQHVCWGKATAGMTWEKQEKSKGQHPGYQVYYASNKTEAIALTEKLLQKELVFAVTCGFQKDFRNMGWWNFSHQFNFRLNGKWFYKKSL